MMMLLRFHKYVIMERLKKIVCLCFTILCLWPGQVLAEGNEEKAQEGRFDWTPVMEAIIKVESNGNRLARCGQSVGVMQITPILVAECNQILKKLKKKRKVSIGRPTECVEIKRNVSLDTGDTQSDERRREGDTFVERRNEVQCAAYATVFRESEKGDEDDGIAVFELHPA
jgi:hypothetical protein